MDIFKPNFIDDERFANAQALEDSRLLSGITTASVFALIQEKPERVHYFQHPHFISELRQDYFAKHQKSLLLSSSIIDEILRHRSLRNTRNFHSFYSNTRDIFTNVVMLKSVQVDGRRIGYFFERHGFKLPQSIWVAAAQQNPAVMLYKSPDGMTFDVEGDGEYIYSENMMDAVCPGLADIVHEVLPLIGDDSADKAQHLAAYIASKTTEPAVSLTDVAFD